MKSRYIVLEGDISQQGSESWLNFRKGKITASMAAAIMNVNPFQTRLQLFEEIFNDTPRPKSSAMERGSRLEKHARNWLNKSLGKNYQPAVLQSVAHPDFIASLDGFYENEEGKPHLIEIKCLNLKDHMAAQEGKTPEYAFIQMQHQMDLVGADNMLFVSYYVPEGKDDDEGEGVIVPVLRDEYYCATLFAEELAFLDSIIACKPPAPSERDFVKNNDPERVSMALRMQELHRQIKESQQEYDFLESCFKETSLHPREMVGPMKIQRSKRQGLLDYPRIIKEYDVRDIEKYRKDSIENWRFSFSKE
jgi:putative phage-type endonuclease